MTENSLPSISQTFVVKNLFRFLKHRIIYGTLLLPYGRKRHRELLASSTRSDSHNYTCFYRSPQQLDGLCGPVLQYLGIPANQVLQISLFACSIGAEAYTIASELRHRFPSLKFIIRASDLHQKFVDHAMVGRYSLREIEQDLSVPQAFIDRTFTKNGQAYLVRSEIKDHVKFRQLDLLAPDFKTSEHLADIVVAQNVLFHMPQDLARKAFDRIASVMKPRSALLIDGMELDMRVDLTNKFNLVPLDYKVQEIYEHSRRHIPLDWWNYYFGNEPFFPFASDPLRRYSTIFTSTKFHP
jgi:chemotaxis methyl-accepting protein methylase